MLNRKMQKLGAHRSSIREIFEYGKKRKAEIGEENVFDFSLGNPNVPSPDCVNDAILDLVKNTDPSVLHSYTSAQGDASVRKTIADNIQKKHGFSANENDIYMTVGAAAALTCSLTAVVTDGEEVIVLAPYFPEYKVFIERCGGVCREVLSDEVTFQPDFSRLEKAITEKTSAIIVNSPNNPTGVVISEENIKKLSSLLERKEKELNKTIYLIADEPYRELVFDGAKVPYLPNYYKDTLVCYSYSKSLSLPGERIGYVFVPNTVDSAKEVYEAIAGAGRALGFVCAPSLLQRVVARCDGQTSDIEIYNKNRKILLEKLTEYGFTLVKPEGAFYLFMKTPTKDASEFCEVAKKYELLLVPSDSFGCPSYVRISYCVKTEQILSALPSFEKLAKEYNLRG